MAKKGYNAPGIGKNKLEAADKMPKSLLAPARGHRENSQSEVGAEYCGDGRALNWTRYFSTQLGEFSKCRKFSSPEQAEVRVGLC